MELLNRKLKVLKDGIDSKIDNDGNITTKKLLTVVNKIRNIEGSGDIEHKELFYKAVDYRVSHYNDNIVTTEIDKELKLNRHDAILVASSKCNTIRELILNVLDGLK